jgi:hypothetical protein
MVKTYDSFEEALAAMFFIKLQSERTERFFEIRQSGGKYILVEVARN